MASQNLTQGSGGVVAGVFNNTCNFSNTLGSDANTFYSQEDANKKLLGCTAINGSLIIATNYTGLSFNLSGITSVSGYIGSNLKSFGNVTWIEGLQSIVADDLISLKTLVVSDLPYLSNLSFAKVESIDQLSASFKDDPATVSFPSLISASKIQLSGNITDIQFPNLETVNKQLSISTQHFVDEYTALNVSSLRSVAVAKLTGRFSYIWMQSLSTAQNITIESEPACDMKLPVLTNASSIELGPFNELDLSSLSNATYLKLISSEADSIDLTSLVNSTTIDISGEPSDVQLPALQTLGPQGKIKILSQFRRINCTSSTSAYERALSTLKNNSPKLDRIDQPTFECRFESAKTPLTDKQKTLLGVGTGFAIVIFFVGLAILWRILKKRKQKRVAQQEQDKETVMRYANMRGMEGLRGVTGSETTVVNREHGEFEEARRLVSPI